MTRQILTLQDPSTLSNSDLLLYKPYKNLVFNFYQLATQKNANQFDFITRQFNGIDNADESIRHYYESFLGITSYFQAAKGGRGKYIEKKLASAVETCCLDNKISDLPKLFLYPDLIRKHKLLGKETLSIKEKKVIRLCEWDFIANSDETTDLCNIFKEDKTITFLELKNRIDSGGTASRREIYDNKFQRILTYFIENKPIFKKENSKYSLLEFYQHFKINKIQLALGILFSTTGELADKESDKKFGFFSSSKDCFKDLVTFIQKNDLKILEQDNENLSLKLKIAKDFTIEIKNIYGSEISNYLFHQKISLNDLIKNKYDDIWLFQLLAIDERHHLLKYGENLTINFIKKIKADSKLRKNLSNFITNQKIENLKSIIQKFSKNKNLIPKNRNIKNYLTDILYFIFANNGDI